MNQDHSDQVMVVVLNDMVTKSVPGMLAICHKLEEGATLLGSEVNFFIHSFLTIRWINSAAATGTNSMILNA